MARSTVTIKKKATGITYCTQPKIPKKKLLSHTPTTPHRPKLLSIKINMMPKEATSWISRFIGIPCGSFALCEDFPEDLLPEDRPALRVRKEEVFAAEVPFRLPEVLPLLFFALLLFTIIQLPFL